MTIDEQETDSVTDSSEFLQKQQLFPVRCETQVISSEESPRGQTALWIMSSAQSAVRFLGLEVTVTSWNVLLGM